MTYREVEHSITVAAAATDIYRLLTDVENWPRLFPPSVYVDYAERDGNQERIRIWATANGAPASWTSRRMLDPEALRITFWQEVSTPPIAEMTGTWIIEPLETAEGAGPSTRVRLGHRYRAIDDDPAGLDWIAAAVETNTNAELPSLRDSLELNAGSDERTLSFEDSVRVDGSAKDVYDFVNEADRWPERLPHVGAVTLTEETPGLQTLRLETRTADGSTHITESVRVTFPHTRIAYKQTTLPALLTLHTGYWQFIEEDDGSVTATSQHTVVIATDRITEVLGADAGLPGARAFIRKALSGNSSATLEHAKRYAESLVTER